MSMNCFILDFYLSSLSFVFLVYQLWMSLGWEVEILSSSSSDKTKQVQLYHKNLGG